MSPNDAAEAAGPNAEQIHYWNDLAGPRWVTAAEGIDAHVEPLGRLALDRAAVASGERVLDVGCGCGGTTLELARRVGASGRVVGLDVSKVMLELAAKRSAQHAHVSFVNEDAQTTDLSGLGEFDLVFSRFGVMFFADPVAAFANLRGRGGRLVFVCWQELARNPWVRVPLQAAARHVELPPRPEPGSPGPFGLADRDRVERILREAGYGEVGIEGVETSLDMGGIDRATEFALEVGPTGRAVREVDAATRERVAAAVREAFTAQATSGRVELGAAVWIVHAR